MDLTRSCTQSSPTQTITSGFSGKKLRSQGPSSSSGSEATILSCFHSHRSSWKSSTPRAARRYSPSAENARPRYSTGSPTSSTARSSSSGNAATRTAAGSPRWAKATHPMRGHTAKAVGTPRPASPQKLSCRPESAVVWSASRTRTPQLLGMARRPGATHRAGP